MIYLFTGNKTGELQFLSRRCPVGKIVTVVNQKGGVGKTTTCVSLVAALREKGQKVLLCDFVPQANATPGMGVDKSLSQGI